MLVIYRDNEEEVIIYTEFKLRVWGKGGWRCIDCSLVGNNNNLVYFKEMGLCVEEIIYDSGFVVIR